MDKLMINRKIAVKVKVTEGFKNQIRQELQDSMAKLDAELKFLEQRAKKLITELTLKGSPQVASVREQLEFEKQKREDTKKAMSEQMKIVGNLGMGEEVLQEEIQGPLEIKVGDSWLEIMNREIVLEDGRIVEIR